MEPCSPAVAVMVWVTIGGSPPCSLNSTRTVVASLTLNSLNDVPANDVSTPFTSTLSTT